MKKLFLSLATLALGLSFAQDLPDRLVVGMVPSREADAIVDSLDPLADMLSERLLIPVETFVSSNYTALVEAIGTGTVDVGLFGPAALVQAIDRYDARPILASVRNGETSYRSQFSVATDSDIQDFEDLRGRTIAFVDPASASGYQFPYVFLLNEYGIDANTDMDAIFAGSHDAAMLALYNGDVDVALTFDGGQSTIAGDFPDVMERVRVLGFTSDIPNDGMVVRQGISDEVAQQIAQAMIEIAETEEGAALTEQLFNVTAFAPISSEAYDVVREVSATFQR